MVPNIQEIIAQMTLEEKAGLCSGLDFWQTKAVERLGIPSIMMTDGPHGLRKQKLGMIIWVYSIVSLLLVFRQELEWLVLGTGS